MMMMTRFSKGSNYWFSVLFAVIILFMGGAGSASASGVTVFHDQFDTETAISFLPGESVESYDDWNEKYNLWTGIAGKSELKNGRLGLQKGGAGTSGIDTSSGASGTVIVAINKVEDPWRVYLGEGDLFTANDLILS